MTVSRGLFQGLALFVLIGCGDVDLGRPKDRKLQPDKNQTSKPARPGSAAPRSAPTRQPAIQSMSFSQALRVVQDPAAAESQADRAIEILSRDATKATSHVRRLLHAQHAQLRRRGAKAIGRMGSAKQDGITLAKLVTSDSSADVQASAATALAELGAYRSMNALYSGMEDSNSAVRNAAYVAVQRMGGQVPRFDPYGSAQTRKRQVDAIRSQTHGIRARAAAIYKKAHGRFAYDR